MPKAIKGNSVFFNQRKIGKAKAPIREAREIYLLMRTTNNQTRKVNRETKGARATSTPKPVATPLPPFPFRKMEKLWPQIAQTPAIIGRKREEGKYYFARRTTTAPFPMSKNKVTNPGKGPTTRRTLVAPIL